MDQRLKFEQPVPVWLVAGEPDAGVRRIADVNDGLAALHRYGIEALGGMRPCSEWRHASRALRTARRLATADSVEAARSALRYAAASAGALADPEPIPAPIALYRSCAASPDE